jgi:hypothetical protein
MQRTLYLSPLDTLPRFKPLPFYKRLISWIVPFERSHIVVSNGQQCYTHPLNLETVRKILESNGYKVVLRANLTSVEKK